jgi:hypothetical protein
MWSAALKYGPLGLTTEYRQPVLRLAVCDRGLNCLDGCNSGKNYPTGCQHPAHGKPLTFLRAVRLRPVGAMAAREPLHLPGGQFQDPRTEDPLS